MTHRVTRRKLLIGLGGVGALAAGRPAIAALDPEPPYTHYTYAQSTADAGNLRVAWYERVNGTVVRGSDPDGEFDPGTATYVDDVDGPGVAVAGAVPGDRGALVVGLLAENADLNVWVRLDAVDSAENGQNEPERDAEGEDVDGVGELPDAIDAAVWRDAGLAGLGRCDGRLGPGESPLATGRFADAADVLSAGVRLRFANAGADCPDALPAETPRCVAFRWALDADVDNRVQSDSLGFALRFAATECGDETTPFAEVTA
jgi:hypothetical protein